ncbi:MAG: ammonia-forming cytochrome c nitrite reductase subunit c552 [Planctomycetota bacterium]
MSSASIPWLKIAVAAAAVSLGAGIYADWRSAAPPDALAKAEFVGRDTCAKCHQQELAEWTGSHHDKAMDYATEQTVLADFDDTTYEWQGVTTRFFRDGERFMVNTEGPDGEYEDFEVKYTFGVDPLQQYMVEFDDGRVQVLRVSWDVNKNEWFYVYPPDVTDEKIEPGDPLHWTGIAQNWNTTCAICHSTNLQKNYDLATNTYHTTWSEIDVSCEECHGPGSLHVELAEATSLFWDRVHGYGLAKIKSVDNKPQIETCAECHSRRFAVHPNFRPGTPLLDSYEPSLLHEGLYHADGQILDEVYVYGSFVQSKMHAKGVRCTDCHNPHSLKLEAPGNQMCAKCHEPAKYDVVSHHHHPDPKPGVASAGASCVDCHMPATTYMVRDPRRDHSFRVPRPDLTVSVGTPNACNNCHTKEEENAEWAAAKVVEWFGERRWDDPHWAPAIAAGRVGKPEGEAMLAELAGRAAAPAIVRATAVDLLARYSGRPSVEAIGQALEDDDDLVRVTAVRTQPLATEADARKLAPRLSDPSLAVRMEASRKLVGVPERWLTAEEREVQQEGLIEYRERQLEDAEHAGTHMNLSNLEAQTGNLPGAIDALRTSIRLEPYLAGARGRLASLLEAERRASPSEIKQLREKEVELLERDAGYAADNANVFYRLGLLRYQIGDADGAADALAEACRLAPETPDHHLALALQQEAQYAATSEQRHFDAAVEALKKLHELIPGDPTATQVLQRIMATRKQKEE